MALGTHSKTAEGFSWVTGLKLWHCCITSCSHADAVSRSRNGRGSLCNSSLCDLRLHTRLQNLLEQFLWRQAPQSRTRQGKPHLKPDLFLIGAEINHKVLYTSHSTSRKAPHSNIFAILKSNLSVSSGQGFHLELLQTSQNVVRENLFTAITKLSWSCNRNKQANNPRDRWLKLGLTKPKIKGKMWNLTIPEKLSCSSCTLGKTGYATRRWAFFFVSLGWYFRMRNFLLTGILPSSRGRCGAWSFKNNHHDAISDILTHLHSFWPFQDTQTSPIGARCSSSERHVTWLRKYQFSFYLTLLDSAL